VFPSVWTHIDTLIAAGDLRAPEEVLTELSKKDDAAYAWAKKKGSLVFFFPWIPVFNWLLETF
jgi:hypothetical protein